MFVTSTGSHITESLSLLESATTVSHEVTLIVRSSTAHYVFILDRGARILLLRDTGSGLEICERSSS
jgi:hypothetical protein